MSCECFLFAEEKVDLPDLTTVISVENDFQDEVEVPDFSDVILLPEETGKLVPELPEIGIDENVEPIESVEENQNNQIYAEGKIGGGYPASFTGDFAVSRIFGKNPFKISFNHNSSAGYSGYSLSEGYNNNETKINIEKQIDFEKLTILLEGDYQDLGNGFQSKVENISSINQDRVFGKGNIFWTLQKGFYLNGFVDSELYNRFTAAVAGTSETECPEWLKGNRLFSIESGINAGWQGNGIDTKINATYSFTDTSVNRVETGADFLWQKDLFSLYSNFAFVFGNSLNDNSFLVPFGVGFNASFPVYFSDRKLSILLEGGLKSEQKKSFEYENNYKFSCFSFVPGEVSAWYSNFRLTLPLKLSFSANIGVNFEKSAFGNYQYIPDYSDLSLVNGVYEYSKKDWNALHTVCDFTYKYKLFAITVKWWANWLEIPILENKHNFLVTMSLQGKQENWGASVETYYSIDAADKTPYINFEAYSQITTGVKIVVSADDIVKLVCGETRTYAGQYVCNSGNVTLLMKFLF